MARLRPSRRYALPGPMASAADVVHVVRGSAVRAAQKTHAPLTTTVTRGSLWPVEDADHAASICEGAGRGVGAIPIAKVRVAGSSPVVRSR